MFALHHTAKKNQVTNSAKVMTALQWLSSTVECLGAIMPITQSVVKQVA